LNIKRLQIGSFRPHAMLNQAIKHIHIDEWRDAMKKMIVLLIVLLLSIGGVPAVLAQQDALDVSGAYPNAKFTYQTLEEGKILLSVTDADEKPILGLTRDELIIRKGARTAQIVSVEPLETSQEIPLHTVLVVDNSFSMRLRNATEPLKTAMEFYFKTVRPIDQVSIVIFDEKESISVAGHSLRARVLQTNNVDYMRAFIAQSMDRHNLTEGTYLNEAILAGIDLAGQAPPNSNKFMVIFSDGEDINSRVTNREVEQAARGLENFSIYAVDFMERPTLDPFLNRLTANHGGYAWKAGSAAELASIFEAFSSTLLHRYIVTYRFIEAPAGALAFDASELTIEEITTIDSAPLLNHVYFETGRSELPDRYVLFAGRNETAGFDEKMLKGGMEKYHNVLNVIGKRLQDHPEATIRLVGCNSNTGEESGRIDLSRGRAEAVQAYLRYVWGIDPQRMTVEQRNLPEAPSNNRVAAGRVDNQRAEIYSDHPAILETIDSEYITKISHSDVLRIVPQIKTEAGIAEWQVSLRCGDQAVTTVLGDGTLPGHWDIPLDAEMVEQFSACEQIDARIIGRDNEGNPLDSGSEVALPVNFIQRTEQMAQVQGHRVREQYALILFDFDSAAIKERNEAIVQRIVARMRLVPDAVVMVVGHTDNIGSEAYNLQLSERRAQAVRQSLIESDAPQTDRLLVSGVGPNQPLYNNDLPEGRALNRTVTISLEYFQQP
jgi:outer membrane protein OmpA-like peptidoglycan-associated protein